MKKVFKYIALAAIAATAAVSCRYGEDEISNPVDKAADMTITIGEVSDYSCSFTIAPSRAASYYSYSVVKGNVTEAPDAATLYAVKAGGIKKGTFKYTADSQNATVEMAELTPNTDYTIFAVAGSPEGVPGVVAIKPFHTTDTGIPSLKEADIVDVALVLVFDEAVKPVSEKSILVEVYAPASMAYQHPFMPADKLGEFSLSDGKADGASVSFDIPEDSYIGGAYLAVSYPEGAFVDAVGNPVGGLTSYVFGNYYSKEEGGWYPETHGLVLETEAGTYELGKALDLGDVTSIVDEEGSPVPVLYFPIEEGIGYYFSTSTGNLYLTVDWNDEDLMYGTVTYSQTSEDGRVSYKELVLGSSSEDSDAVYDVITTKSGDYGVIYLLEEPLAGDTVTIEIPAWAYVDIWGRYNAPKTYEFVYQPSAE